MPRIRTAPRSPLPKSSLQKNLDRLSVLQYLLYAEGRRSLLVVLQGIDAGGKDGTIRHVMSGLNPQGVKVTAFKVPEGAEKRHDYLWRVHHAVPEFGQIGIFNRSHYEDVLVVRVHSLVPKSVWSKPLRADQRVRADADRERRADREVPALHRQGRAGERASASASRTRPRTGSSRPPT